MSVKSEAFGKNQFGEEVTLFTLTNGNGVVARIMNHGGAIVSLETPDSFGKFDDIVLGHDSAAEYVQDTPYFGSLVGRFANRIKNGTFELDGATYTLACNNGPNALHGGIRGFDKVVWDTEIIEADNAIRMTYTAADGEEGFPGELSTVCTYSLSVDNELKIKYTAETTKQTVLNFTNHSFFNLAGHDAGDTGAQVISINADSYLPTDATAIPLGEEAAVVDTPLDFSSPQVIGERIDSAFEQIQFAAGYDHNYCLNKDAEGELSFAARAEDPKSGRIMEVYTTEPGMQFYTGNFLDGTLKGKKGCMYVRRGGYCLETQHYPDSPNQPQFPSTSLNPGETFRSQTVYKFLTR